MDLIREIATLGDLPRIVASHHGSKRGVAVEDESLTYAELEERSNQVAQALARDGVKQGDRVALLGRESLSLLCALFGAAKIKAVAVPLNPGLSPEEIGYILTDAAPAAVFLEAELAPRLLPAISKLARPPRRVVLVPSPGASTEQTARATHFECWLGETPAAPLELAHHPDDAVVQIYTSGTTGRPKGVILANRSFFGVAREFAARDDAWIGLCSEDVHLIFFPTFHVAGLWGLCRGIALGATNILLRGFQPARVLELIPRHRVTLVGMIPAAMHLLLVEPGCQGTDFSSLRNIYYGGSPASPALLERARAVFLCNFCQIYGLTETGNVAVTLRPEEHFVGNKERLLSAGRPAPGVELRIITREGRPARVRETGEIAIRSPGVMIGYWNAAEATQRTLIDGWLMTGDAGYLDEDGYLYVSDRLKDMIICAGENIYPAEIENVLRGHESVADAAVIGIPDEVWGEAILAFVVPRPGSERKTAPLIKHARSRLADFKVPRSIEFVDKLPRTASGKILKNQLREPYWHGRERNVN
jgi:acyl-CoA synthetase (AMP-forming)/AMP-acid ligase II